MIGFFSGAALEISACGFLYVIQGLLKGGSKGFHNSKPQIFVGSAEPMEPTLTWPLLSKQVCATQQYRQTNFYFKMKSES